MGVISEANKKEIPSDAPRPRLCHIVKREDFNGYGFNLHAQKAKPGQFIGTVDANSPAEVAGLKEGDRILEVNGVNIAHENHRQVVERIKAVSNETSLLVVDKTAEDYYRKLDIVVTSDLPNVLKQSSVQGEHVPDVADQVEELKLQHAEIQELAEEEDEEEDGIVIKQHHNVEVVKHEEPETVRRLSSRSSTSSIEKTAHSVGTASASGSSLRSTPSPQPRSQKAQEESLPDSPTTNPGSPRASNYDGLNLNMTAAEMREIIGAKKKKDPRKDQRMDFRKKYEIIQTL